MNKFHTMPVHPGHVLQDELKELGLTQTELAKHINVLPKTIGKICRGEQGLNALMSMKLSRALGASPQFWLNLQNNWEISQTDKSEYRNI